MKLLDFKVRVQQIPDEHLAFLNECGFELSETKKYARSHQPRVHARVYKGRRRQRWSVITFLYQGGMDRGLAVEGSVNRWVMRSYLLRIALQRMKALGIKAVILDNLSVHKTEEVCEAFEEAGMEVIYTPPYSPECNAIEEGFAKAKHQMRIVKNKSSDNMTDHIGQAFDNITPKDAQGFFRHWRETTL